MTTLAKKGEFAALMGWSPSYVTELGKKGRLVFAPCGKLIDVDATLLQLEKTADPSKQGVKERWADQRGDLPDPPKYQEGDAIMPPDLVLEYDYQVARAKRETHLANIAELDERQRLGQLVDINIVMQAITDLAAAFRAAIERLPDRIAPVLAAESDPKIIYQLLDDEGARMLDELVRNTEQLPATISAAKKS
ncbi:hypothetical protein [Chitinibacter sp. GC72]|uniref:hypothetical protein n=1 Tax=Chitinibacter sp. GC72 TaxID=1526917 RepID=UPI0012FB780A|nr:hypothetical protein [Chitinibacter sp. GC72]